MLKASPDVFPCPRCLKRERKCNLFSSLARSRKPTPAVIYSFPSQATS